MVNFSGDTILIAVTVPKSLDVVCDYAIPLANRTGHKALLFVLLVHEDAEYSRIRSEDERKLNAISKKGEIAGIEIKTEIVWGSFPEKVAECLYDLDCPLLVVGDGDDRAKRLKELKQIESILVAKKAWHHRSSHHFLVVSERRKDPVLVIFNQRKREKKDEIKRKGNEIKL